MTIEQAALVPSLKSPVETQDDVAHFLRQPLTIGSREVAGRLWLAPMAGMGHVPLRSLVDAFGGCGLLFTGMCNARAVPTEKPSRSSAFSWRQEELDHCVMQLFGGEPEVMAEAARRVEAEGFFGVDLNMGCSVAAIVRRGYGAALLRDHDHAVRIVEAVRAAVNIPLFVKFRTGWIKDPEPAVALARRFEDAGVDALVFHPRVAPDRRTRPPYLSHIAQVKEAVRIPVIGNGDVFTPEAAKTMLATTGCDGIALGRIAISRPWVFAAWTGLLHDDPLTNPELWQTTPERMLDALEAAGGDSRYIARQFGRFMLYYIANFLYGATLRGALTSGTSAEIMREAVRKHLYPLPTVSRSPIAAMY